MAISASRLVFNALNKVVIWSRKDESYAIDARIQPLSAAAVGSRRALEAARGLIRKQIFRECGNPVFLGGHVRLLHPRHISLGSGCSISEYVLIDGLSVEGISIGNNVTIERYATIRATDTLRELGVGVRIGNNFSLGAFSYVGAAAGVTIGDDVLVGQFVGIYAENHLFESTTELIREQGVSRAGITIGNDCWIGAGASILDGVNIGKGCVVGAGSVVTRDVEPYSLVAGIPAVTIKSRK